MIYVLTGPNDFMRNQRKRELTAAFIAEYSDLAYEIVDGEEADIDRIKEALESLPFLSTKKLVVLTTPGVNKTFVEQHKELLGGVPETTDLIIDEPKFDKRSGYYKYAKKLGGFEEFTELDRPALSKWMNEYVKKWEAEIDRAATEELLERVGNDQRRLASELDKLCMFTSSVDKAAVRELTTRTPSSTIFELIDAAFSGNKKRALELYREQRALQVSPMQIVAMLAWQFHVLAVVKTAENIPVAEIASEARLNPYVIQKSMNIVRRLSLQELKTLIARLKDIDEKMKTTRVDADDALQAFILTL